MKNTIIQVIRLLTGSIIYEIDGNKSDGVIELCTNFVLRDCERMAPVYRMAIKLIVLYFNYETYWAYRKTFLKLAVRDRVTVINKWQNGNLSFKRQFLKLVLNLTLLAYYDSRMVTDSLGIDRGTYLRMLSFYAGL